MYYQKNFIWQIEYEERLQSWCQKIWPLTKSSSVNRPAQIYLRGNTKSLNLRKTSSLATRVGLKLSGNPCTGKLLHHQEWKKLGCWNQHYWFQRVKLQTILIIWKFWQHCENEFVINCHIYKQHVMDLAPGQRACLQCAVCESLFSC